MSDVGASFPVLFKKPNRKNKYTMFIKLKLNSGNWLPPTHPPSFEFFFVSRHCFPTRTLYSSSCLVSLETRSHQKLRSGTCSSKKRPQGGSTSRLSARVTWATRSLEKVVSSGVASGGMCWKKEPRVCVSLLFSK